MLDDRSYMRDTPLRHERRWCSVIMVATVVVFALQMIYEVYFRRASGLVDPVGHYLALSHRGLARGYVWQLLTFQFLHVGLGHLLGNLIGLWFFGRFVEERLGARRFLQLYFLSGVAGGLLHSLLAWGFPGQFGLAVYGASAGVLGLIAAFALLEPEGEILLFFVLPLKAKVLLWFELGISIFFTLVPAQSGVAHAAHLGGILFAMGFVRWMNQPALFGWAARSPGRPRELVTTRASRSFSWRRQPPAPEPELGATEFISKEVDPILDKISAHGMQSLTERERQILESARAKMSKRG